MEGIKNIAFAIKSVYTSKIVMGLIFITFIIGVLIAAVIFISSWYDANRVVFHSPIEVKLFAPVRIEKRPIVSPVASRSAGLVPQAFAEELTNPYDSRSPKGVAWEIIKEKFGVQHWGAYEELIQNESGWNPYSVNSSSGACGIGQALPCSKMSCEKWDYECQVNWTADYIEDRYETPIQALAFWNKQSPHWY